jgi:hypothetical protein
MTSAVGRGVTVGSGVDVGSTISVGSGAGAAAGSAGELVVRSVERSGARKPGIKSAAQNARQIALPTASFLATDLIVRLCAEGAGLVVGAADD